jgi:hypothetical protein
VTSFDTASSTSVDISARGKKRVFDDLDEAVLILDAHARELAAAWRPTWRDARGRATTSRSLKRFNLASIAGEWFLGGLRSDSHNLYFVEGKALNWTKEGRASFAASPPVKVKAAKMEAAQPRVARPPKAKSRPTPTSKKRGKVTTGVTESDIVIDERGFFEFAARVEGPHTAWLRRIGEAHARGEYPRFSFKMFEGTDVIGHETNPELAVVLKAIAAHAVIKKIKTMGRVYIEGEIDGVPKTLAMLFYKQGGFSIFRYTNGELESPFEGPIIDFSKVTIDVPTRR